MQANHYYFSELIDTDFKLTVINSSQRPCESSSQSVYAANYITHVQKFSKNQQGWITGLVQCTLMCNALLAYSEPNIIQ